MSDNKSSGIGGFILLIIFTAMVIGFLEWQRIQAFLQSLQTYMDSTQTSVVEASAGDGYGILIFGVAALLAVLIVPSMLRHNSTSDESIIPNIYHRPKYYHIKIVK